MPPLAAAYQSTAAPEDGVAEIVIEPLPHLVAGEEAVIVGSARMVNTCVLLTASMYNLFPVPEQGSPNTVLLADTVKLFLPIAAACITAVEVDE